MVSKLEKQAFTSEFESHWVPNPYGLLLHLGKRLNELLLTVLAAFRYQLRSFFFVNYSNLESFL